MGGLDNEVDIDQESISRYQESISWSIHQETRRFSPGGGLWNEVGIDQENISRYQKNISRSIHRETRKISPGVRGRGA